MRQLIAATAAVLGALCLVGAAGAGVSVGVNDDAGKYADGGAQFWQTMASEGLKQNAMTVLWDETRPTTIVDQSFIEHALPAAQAAGIQVEFDVYPMHSQAFTSDPSNIQRFGAFLGELARTFPQVTQYVVMNECNQTRFINPQFSGTAKDSPNQSAALCGQALAAGYDALKAVNPDIFVWGVGLSPRGNDDPTAPSNVSTSPVKFLAALGQWYRSSGRTKPLMDGFDFHPYPIPQSLPFAQGYANQNDASVTNLSRIYQAFYDAFDGTGQPTIGQQAGGGLPVSLNEVGIQTDTTGHAGYTGTEASANANGGVLGATATEAYQAQWYTQMLNLVACDPNVKVVNIFHLVDESDLGAWQSGLYWVGYQPKQSATAIKDWIAQTGGNCTGQMTSWTPAGVPAAATTTTTAQAAAAVVLLRRQLTALDKRIAAAKKAVVKARTKQAKAVQRKRVALLLAQRRKLAARLAAAVESAKAAKPGKPAKPANAAKPSKPSKPAKPSKPGKPSTKQTKAVGHGAGVHGAAPKPKR